MITEDDVVWFAGQGANQKILTDLANRGPLAIQEFLGGSDWQRLNELETDPESLACDGPIKHWFEPLQGLNLIDIDAAWTVAITEFGLAVYTRTQK